MHYNSLFSTLIGKMVIELVYFYRISVFLFVSCFKFHVLKGTCVISAPICLFDHLAIQTWPRLCSPLHPNNIQTKNNIGRRLLVYVLWQRSWGNICPDPVFYTFRPPPNQIQKTRWAASFYFRSDPWEW